MLNKTQRGVTTTEIGTRFLEHCRCIVDDLDEALASTRQLQTAIHGKLRVNVPVDFGVQWIGRVVAEFANTFPELLLEVDINSHVSTVSTSDYDVTVVMGSLMNANPHMVSRRIATITRGIYASPVYLARCGTPRTVQELEQHDCIVTTQQRTDGSWSLKHGDTHCAANVTGRLIVNSISIARELAIGHRGLCMLPLPMCMNDVRSNRLVHVLTDWESPPLHATALVMNRRSMPHKIRTFLNFLKDRLNPDSSAAALEVSRLP